MLHNPLGKWTIITQRWEGYYYKEHVYKKEGKWFKHQITNKARSTYTATKAREEANVPRGAVPITDVKERNTLTFTLPTPIT